MIPIRPTNVIDDIVDRFDRRYYPHIAVERVTEAPSQSDQELVQGSSFLPKDLQVMTYDYAPNISNWILSTGLLRSQKDLTTQKAIEESAANRLTQLGVVRAPGFPATHQLMRHVCQTVFRDAEEWEKNQFVSRIIKNSRREVVIEFLWHALFKIESILVRSGMFLLIAASFVIPVGLSLALVSWGIAVLTQAGIIAALIGGYFLGRIVIVVFLATFSIFRRPVGRILNSLDDSLIQLQRRNRIDLLNKQTRKASELWVKLLLDTSYRTH